MNIPDEIAPVKARILELSFNAFNAKGYRSVSMDAVSRELRISKKTIYKHFAAKDEILETALEYLFEGIEQRLKKQMRKVSEKEAMQAYFVIYREFVHALNPVLRAEIEAEIPYLFERINTFERQVLKRSFAALLKDLRARKVIDYPSPTREFTSTFFSLLQGLVDAPEEKATFMLQALYKGMALKKKKKK